MKLVYLHSTPIDSEKANLIQVISMCNAFAENGIDVKLVLPELNNSKNSQELKEKKLKDLKNVSFSIFPRITKNGKLSKYLIGLGVFSILKREKPDIVFVRTPTLFLTSWLAGYPVVFEFHNSLLHEGNTYLNRIFTSLFVYISKTKKAPYFISISEALMNFWVSKGIPKEKSIALHDGFTEEQFENQPSTEEARTQLALPLDKKIITYTGSLYFDREIDSILKLATDFPDCFFLVVGGPNSNAEQFENQANQSKIENIKFTGRVFHQEVPNYLAASDILLGLWSSKVKTINYCSPLKVFEYMASGKLIIAHGFPTILEVLKDGENGFIAKPDSYEDLKRNMKRALEETSSSAIGKNARNDAYKYYTWKSRASLIINKGFRR